MTPKQRQAKLTTIKALIESFGFHQDRYGNYKNILNEQEYRIKIKKVNIRIEKKFSHGWFKVMSKPFSSLPIEHLAKWLTKFQPTND